MKYRVARRLPKLSAEFGLAVLDEAMEGGVPRGYVLILEEDTGLSSDVMVSQFVAGGLLGSENVFFLNTDFPSSTIRTLLSSQGIDVTGFENGGKLTFMNAFGVDEPGSEKSLSAILDISDLKEIGSSVKDYAERIESPNKFRGVVDSFSTIILSSADEKGAFAFVRSQVIAQKKFGGIVLLTLHKKAHSRQFVAGLEHIVDGVIELRKERYYRDWRSVLQIKKMVGRKFSTREFNYAIQEGKFLVE